MLCYHLSWILTDSERKKFREQLLYAEQELAAARGREQALQEQLFKEVRDSQERLKRQIQLHSEMEVNLFTFVICMICLLII